jgi:hypothetical protein
MNIQKYIINQNDLESLMRYELLYKWHEWQKLTDDKHNTFADYLLNDTPYQPDHELIQSFCRTSAEKENPVTAGIYKELRPADVAKYQLKWYTKYNGE